MTLHSADELWPGLAQEGAHLQPRLCFVTWGSRGGPFGQVAQSLLAGFRELAVPFDVVYLEGPRGVRTHDAVPASREVRLGTRRAQASVQALYQYFRSARPTLALVSPAHLVPFTFAAGKLGRCPVVPWEPTFLSLDMPDLAWRMRILPLLRRLLYGRCPAVATVSTDVGAELPRSVAGQRGERLFMLPNPLDAERIRRLARENGSLAQSGPYLCAAGRLTHQKGFDLLIEAVEIAGPTLPPGWRLVILGDGPHRNLLRKLAADRGLTKHVELPGAIENPYPIIANAEVFVHPARWEGFGLVIGEALALGVPVIATSCPGGPHEILCDGDYGVLVPPEQPRALAEAISRLMSDAALRNELRSRGPQRAEAFAPRAIAERALTLVERLDR